MNSIYIIFVLTFLGQILNVKSSCILNIEASSAGLDDGNFFKIKINNQPQSGYAQSRGLNFFEIDGISGQILTNRNFDTHEHQTYTNNMISYINNIKPGIIVIVGVVDEAQQKMTDDGYNSLYSIGMTQGLKFGYRYGYVLIGGKDLKATGQAVNSIKAKNQGYASTSKCIRQSIPSNCSNYINVVSGGMEDYERFAYYINYQEKTLPQSITYDRGLFVVIFDKEDASLIKNIKRFDTYGVQADDVNFKNLINSVNSGDHVLIGAMDSVETYLTQNFYTSIQSIGGPVSLNIGYRESFAIIGKKGDTIGNAIWKKNTIGNGGVLIGKCLQGCSYQCNTCSGHKDNCDTCSRTNGVNIKPDCNCAVKFFEYSQTQCTACLNKCAECQNDYECTVCTGTGRLNTAPNCSCLPGYYETGLNQTNCGKCDYPCNNCFGTSTSCVDCSTVDYRKDKSTCQCQDNYYDNNTECLGCIYPCQQCSSVNQCITCKTLQNRVSVTDCNCKPNYYETGSSCEKCDYPCQNCQGAANQCDSCVLDDNRSNTPPCSCNTGYFDNGSNCQKCHYKCSECTDYHTCKPDSCSDATRDSLKNCECNEGKFDKGVSLCSECSYKCKSCNGNAENCDVCAIGLGRTTAVKPQCDCISGFFDNQNEQADCIACTHPCVNCQSLTICDSCVYREFSNPISTCTCIQGYYEESNLQCEICQHQCKSCVNTNQNCQECIDGENRYDSPNCKCKVGYYEDADKICQLCVYPCLKCTQQHVCIDCQTTAYRNLPPLDNSTCNCSDGYYDTGSLCDKCAMQCQTCVNTSIECGSCSEQTRHGGLCICLDGFYDIGVPKCDKCDYKCSTCIDDKDNCIICSDINRDLNNNCLCKEGFYENIYDKICKRCQYPCKKCISLHFCIECVQIVNELPQSRKISPSCHCQNGFFKNEQTQECQKCHSRCNKCENQPENCLECNNQQNRQSVENQCLCKVQGFYSLIQNNIEICEPCNENCLKCTNNKTCIQCINQKALPPKCLKIIDQNNGYLSFSVIIDGQNMQVSKVCDAQCSECENDVKNCTVCSPGIYRNHQLPDCGCIQGYYSVENHIDCKQCHKYCQQCISYDNCQICKKEINRILNIQTGYCICRQGFKEVKGECKKCYNYQGNCVQVCPINTIQDNQLNICKDQNAQFKSNILIILICGTLIIFITIIAKSLFVKILNKNIQLFQKVNNKNTIIDQENKGFEKNKLSTYDKEQQKINL